MSLEDYPPLPPENPTLEQVKRFDEWLTTMRHKIDLLTPIYEAKGMPYDEAHFRAQRETFPEEYWPQFCPKPISLPSEKSRLRSLRIKLTMRDLQEKGKLNLEELERCFPELFKDD